MTDPLRETAERKAMLRKARATIDQWQREMGGDPTKHRNLGGHPSRLEEIVATALRTARDEAAKVADGHAAFWEREASKFREGTDTWCACRMRMHVAMDIATAVRALASKDEQR